MLDLLLSLVGGKGGIADSVRMESCAAWRGTALERSDFLLLQALLEMRSGWGGSDLTAGGS